jgi:hypothetical protein
MRRRFRRTMYAYSQIDVAAEIFKIPGGRWASEADQFGLNNFGNCAFSAFQGTSTVGRHQIVSGSANIDLPSVVVVV